MQINTILKIIKIILNGNQNNNQRMIKTLKLMKRLLRGKTTIVEIGLQTTLMQKLICQNVQIWKNCFRNIIYMIKKQALQKNIEGWD